MGIKSGLADKASLKLNGFTLLEMLFVLLLTSIVISLAFLYFETFQRYLHTQHKTINYEMEVLQFESLFYYDFDRASALEFRHNRLKCVGVGVEYKFDDKYILRIQDKRVDSLKAFDINYTFKYNREKQGEIIGLEIEIDDFNKRRRNYAFRRMEDEKINFVNYQDSRN